MSSTGGTIVFSATSDPANPTITVTGGGDFASVSGNRVDVQAMTGTGIDLVTIETPLNGNHQFTNYTNLYGVGMSLSFTAQGESADTSSNRTANLSVTASTTADTAYNGIATATSAYTISQRGGSATHGYTSSVGINTNGAANPSQTVNCINTGGEYFECLKGGKLSVTLSIAVRCLSIRMGERYRIVYEDKMSGTRDEMITVPDGSGTVGVTMNYEINDVGNSKNVDFGNIQVRFYTA